MNIHDHIREKCELAQTYAEDGAFHTAARIFMELSIGIKEHANACDRMLEGEIEIRDRQISKLETRRAELKEQTKNGK